MQNESPVEADISCYGGVADNTLDLFERFIESSGIEIGQSEIQGHFIIGRAEQNGALKRFERLVKKAVQRQAVAEVKPGFRVVGASSSSRRAATSDVS